MDLRPDLGRDLRRAAGVVVALLAIALAAPATLVPGEPRATATASSTADSPAPDASTPAPARTIALESVAASPAPAREPSRVTASAPPAVRQSRIVPGSVDRSSLDLRVTYDADVTLGYDVRSLRVAATLTLTNTSGEGVDRLELNTVAARLGEMRLGDVTVDGDAVTPTVDDQTIVVPLGGILPPDATTIVTVDYRATLRSSLTGSNWLFTRTKGIASLYRWLPWVSRTTPFDRPNHGDPFVTPVSPRVTVRITTDRPLVIAATGDRVASSGLTQTFVAENVRDFTITASPSFRTASRTVGDTKVVVYSRAGFPASSALDHAAAALGRMNKLVGTYPYPTFKVVQSAGGFGMESPGLIWIPTGVGSSNLEYLVFHETAHQWFYGIVGGDQAREPFTDEAAADFVARYALSSRRSSRCDTAPLDRSIYRYSSTCYYEVVYIQGGNYLDALRRRMGSTAFWRGLRGWIADERYGLATTQSLLDALDAATPLDLEGSFESRFPGLW